MRDGSMACVVVFFTQPYLPASSPGVCSSDAARLGSLGEGAGRQASVGIRMHEWVDILCVSRGE